MYIQWLGRCIPAIVLRSSKIPMIIIVHLGYKKPIQKSAYILTHDIAAWPGLSHRST